MLEDLATVLFDEATIMRRLDELAAQLSADYRDRELTVIAVLNGSLIFMADLLRRIPLPLKVDCLSVASYHGGTRTTGEVVFKQVMLPDVAGRHILILDDILDSGVTLAAIGEKLRTEQPLSVKICVLLARRNRGSDKWKPITSGSTSRTNSWSATASITWSATGICRASACSGKS